LSLTPCHLQRKETHENSIIKIKRDIEKYQIIITGSKASVTVEKIEDRIEKFKSIWGTAANNAQRNKAYRSIVHKIIYDRSEDERVTLRVFYK
jgi:site-specific DNA recombinase